MTDELLGGPLVLRHWSKGRGGDFWGPDDYDVITRDGRDIGRSGHRHLNRNIIPFLGDLSPGPSPP